jgi:hypothetical protein
VIKFVWLPAGRWFSSGALITSTNKTDRHDITKILLKVVLKHHDPKRKKRSISGFHYLCIKECAISEHFVLYVENCSLSIIEDNLALPSDITNKNKLIVSLLAGNEWDPSVLWKSFTCHEFVIFLTTYSRACTGVILRICPKIIPLHLCYILSFSLRCLLVKVLRAQTHRAAERVPGGR